MKLGEERKEKVKLENKLKENVEKTDDSPILVKSPQSTSDSIMTRNNHSVFLKTSKPSSTPVSMLGLTPLKSAPHTPAQIPCSLVIRSSSTPSKISSSTTSSNRPATAACCSPRTPPGPPPRCKDSTSTPVGLSTDTLTLPSKVLKQTENDLKEAQSEVNDEEIVDISEEEPGNTEELIDREILAELDAISRKAYEEDTYSDVDADIENYPEYYWQMDYEDEDG